MTTEKALGPPLELLLSGVSDHGTRHLAEIESDLVQTGSLLQEAISKLSASFMAIHGAVCAQQKMVDSLVSGLVPAPEGTAALRTISDEIALHVNAAVTGLQFQDLTTQLLDRALKRAGGLRGMLGTLGANGSGTLQECSSEQIAALLNGINKTLAIQNEELDGMLWKTVRQMHMESGDIELF